MCCLFKNNASCQTADNACKDVAIVYKKLHCDLSALQKDATICYIIANTAILKLNRYT